MSIRYSFAELQALLNPERLSGQTDAALSGIASLSEAQAGDISFLGNKKYTSEVAKSAASVILVPLDYRGTPADGQTLFFHENPSAALAKLCSVIEAELWPRPEPIIHPSAIIDREATVSQEAYVGPGCVIEAGAVIGAGTVLQAQVYVGRHARIGENCWIRPHATVADYCEVGNRVQIHNGAVIGGEGFGYETINGRHEKVPQVGKVILHDDVEIGANTTIDRARFSATVIGEGSKVDNLVQIGHNVVIGKHCLIVSQVGISGSTHLEDYVVLAGQVGVIGHLKLGKGCILGAQSGVSSDIPAGKYYRGAPAREAFLENKLISLYGRLPEFFTRLKNVEKHLDIDAKALNEPQGDSSKA